MKKISSLISYFALLITALTVDDKVVSIDGQYHVESSNPGVLHVSYDNGVPIIHVMGTGTCELTVWGDVDRTDVEKFVVEKRSYEVVDADTQASHFLVEETGFVTKAEALAAGDTVNVELGGSDTESVADENQLAETLPDKTEQA